ncbi:MAG: DUF3616 domain-containing protein [Rhodocyclaceae bacterium]|nr:DUF3616 domain-containing protein [Rhodocyclaceae bacterium]MDZ4216028.1 DUF3616 domain-containing protein [Rhodocyclaceae bacterium]
MFRPLPDIYEPSAILQLPDGRFLIAEDEKTRPFSLVTIHPDGTTHSVPLATETPGGDFAKLDDLEGLAADAAGHVYAITSHSRSGKGEEKTARERLIRFHVEGGRLVAPVVVSGLKAALIAAHPVLAEAAAHRDVKAEGGLNIEALEITPDQQHLLVGFRSPLQAGHALIARVENPAAMFDHGAAPRIAAQLTTLDLAGHGLRSLSHIPVLDGYLIVSGPVAKEQTQFRLWFWSGREADAPRHASVPGLPGFEHAEGIAPAIIDGQPRIIIVSDDGDREAGQAARFLLLDPKQLQIDD